METRAQKRLKKERKIVRCSILERDEKILTDQQKKEFWIGKNCLFCERVRQLAADYICAICRHPTSRDNLLIPSCQHTFCKQCLYQYLDKTSTKYIKLWSIISENISPHSESFRCPTCRIEVYDINREKHLKKNFLYTALCHALNSAQTQP